MSRFDLDIKWELVNVMSQLGGSKSGLFRCVITDESLWVFWSRKCQVRLRSESGHLGLWYFIELEKERGGGTSAIVNLTSDGVYKSSVATPAVNDVEIMEFDVKAEVVNYLREVLRSQLEQSQD